jgi:hypothetical protein
MQFCPTPCHFISFRCKYFPQPPVLKHSQFMRLNRHHNKCILIFNA